MACNGASGADNSHCGEGIAGFGSDGVALIKRFEACGRRRPDGRYDAYPDPGCWEEWRVGRRPARTSSMR